MRFRLFVALGALFLPLAASAAPLTLHEAYSRALQNNKSLQMAREQVEQSRLNVYKTWSYLGPTINGQISHTWTNEVRFQTANPAAPGFLSPPRADGTCGRPDPRTFGRPVSTGAVCVGQQTTEVLVKPKESTTLALMGSQPILTGELIPGLQAAWHAEEMSQAALENAREQILYNVVSLYYNVAAAEKFVRLSDQSYLNVQDHLRIAQTRFAVGQISKIGVLQAQIEATRAQAALARARNDHRNALLALANLIGGGDVDGIQSAEALTAPTAIPIAFPADPTSEALQRRSDLLVSKNQLRMAEDMKNGKWARFSPILALQGNIQTTDEPGVFGAEENWSVGLVLNVPIMQGGGRVIDLRDSYSKMRQARSQFEAKRDEVRLDVQTAMSKLDVTRQNLSVAQKQSELARENYDITKISFENGLATSLELIDANQGLMGAEINSIREQLNLHLDTLNAYRSVGLLSKALAAPASE